MKDAIISVKGLLGAGENGEDIELVTDGGYSWSPEETEFYYMESQLTGMEGTRTGFTVRPGCVTLTREGTVGMQMVFEEGRKNYFAYNTPFGSAMMGLDTRSITSTLTAEGGHLEIKYLLDMMESVTVRAAVNIDIRLA